MQALRWDPEQLKLLLLRRHRPQLELRHVHICGVGQKLSLHRIRRLRR